MTNFYWCPPMFQLPLSPTECQKCISVSQDEAAFTELTRKYEQLQIEHEKLKVQFEEEGRSPRKKTRSKRRPDEDLVKEYKCPYPFCKKQYASSLALSLHMKNKHNGGCKRERDDAARVLLRAEIKGEKPPTILINLPPNYLQNNRTRLMLSEVYSLHQNHQSPEGYI